MQWNDHSRQVPEGSHAFLGASKYSWLNYTEDKLIETYKNYKAKERGTRLHAFAKECVDLRQKLPKSNKTLNRYVNDAIGFKMRPEQVLYYSKYCYGTADSIIFKDNLLRIHDLKTGVTPASLHQLEIYAALFCLEYDIKPSDIDLELRLYQNDDIQIGVISPEEVLAIMNKIILFDRILEDIDKGE